MPNTIENVAIHDLKKNQNGFFTKMGQEELEVTPAVQRLVDDLYKAYKKTGAKSHGEFARTGGDPSTPNSLRDYLDNHDFQTLTTNMMSQLEQHARRKSAAKGGHIFFCHFTNNGSAYFLVVIVQDKLGLALTGDLKVEDIRHLDTDNFKFAGRVNLTKWENDGERYIGFIRGKGDVSEYFREFLGCNIPVRAKEDTSRLLKAVRDFSDTLGINRDQKNEFIRRAKNICSETAKDGKDLNFGAFSNHLHPDNPEALLEFLNDPDRALTDNFTIDKTTVRNFDKFNGSTKHWKLEFDRDALIRNQIDYDPDNGTLIIRTLPQELVEQLNNEFL